MGLADPLVVVRQMLLDDPAVAALVADRVYSTPLLPSGHTYPLIRLSHIGQSGYAPVGFRHSAVAAIQMDVWGYDQPEVALIAETALDGLHGVSAAPGVNYIVPTVEVRDIDETVQPPLHRYRADLAVRVVRQSVATP